MAVEIALDALNWMLTFLTVRTAEFCQETWTSIALRMDMDKHRIKHGATKHQHPHHIARVRLELLRCILRFVLGRCPLRPS
jgi:hypothetical protein